MPLLTGPLLSLDAKGKFLKNYVFQGTIRGPTFRRLGKNRPPPTTAQIAQQTIVAGSITAWHVIENNATFRAQWRELLRTIRGQHSDYSEWERSAITLATKTPGRGFVSSIKANWEGGLIMQTINCMTGAPATDTAFSQLWMGTTPNNMTIKENVQISGATMTFIGELLPGQTRYIRLTRGGIPASGLAIITYVGPMPNLIVNGTFDATPPWTLGLYYSISGGTLNRNWTSYSKDWTTQAIPTLIPGHEYLMKCNLVSYYGYQEGQMYLGGNKSVSMDHLGQNVATITCGASNLAGIQSVGDPSAWTKWDNLELYDPTSPPP
jgi:hypothetical protein